MTGKKANPDVCGMPRCRQPSILKNGNVYQCERHWREYCENQERECAGCGERFEANDEHPLCFVCRFNVTCPKIAPENL